MKTIALASWSDFPDAVAEIRKDYGTNTLLRSGLERQNIINFRGQADSDWRLVTTLERATNETFSVEEYVTEAIFCGTEIQAFTGVKWELPSLTDMENQVERSQVAHRPHLPCYEYVVYLRHHGFPSPLLDWSSSPYIAAFFALANNNNKADRCAIFAYIETPTGRKRPNQSAVITSLGPFAATHRRHFAQKASYTIATSWNEEEKKHDFCSHHTAADSGPAEQDVLVKLTIPRKDRIDALRQLDDYNINYHTLFQSEDSLIQSLATRVFDLERG